MSKTPSFLICGRCELQPLQHNCDNTFGHCHRWEEDSNEIKSLYVFRDLVIKLFKTVELVSKSTVYTLILYVIKFNQIGYLMDQIDICMYSIEYFYKQTM